MPAEANRVGRLVELVIPAEREVARDEAVEPAVARLGPERHVASRVPVARHEKIQVVVDDEVVAETGDVALVIARGPDQVVQAEPGDEDAAAPSRAGCRCRSAWFPPPAPCSGRTGADGPRHRGGNSPADSGSSPTRASCRRDRRTPRPTGKSRCRPPPAPCPPRIG